MARLSAFITSYNRADFVVTCVRSILAAASESLEVRVIVMDNGSSDETPEVLAKAMQHVPAHGALETLRTEDNRHIVEVINKGFAAARESDPDYIAMFNDDTELTPGSLEAVVAACEAHPDSLLTPLQRNYRQPEHIDGNALGHVRQLDALIEDAVLGRPLRQVYPLPVIIGACMFARAEVWANIGPFDPLFWFYGVDDDICTRARFLGYQTLLVPGAHLFHAHGKLDSSASAMTKEARDRKWRYETQTRYLFMLKKHEVGLGRAVCGTAWHALQNAFTCARHGWPWGAWQSLAIFAWFLPRLGLLAEARRQHFDPARKVDLGPPPGA
ncbi:MAG: glycosyltransferase [Candidatus Hydrogenedens sp.]|nr:glycosyltransferase [Candidatus Hydrogenedens sp.]